MQLGTKPITSPGPRRVQDNRLEANPHSPDPRKDQKHPRLEIWRSGRIGRWNPHPRDMRCRKLRVDDDGLFGGSVALWMGGRKFTFVSRFRRCGGVDFYGVLEKEGIHIALR